MMIIMKTKFIIYHTRNDFTNLDTKWNTDKKHFKKMNFFYLFN
jgi:hypothetical protein